MRNRKAALELSITAIVVLIIAITVLGLGIGFIKKQFTTGTELVESSFTGIKEEFKERVKAGGELLVFTVPEQVSVGKPANMVIGVKNTAANLEGGQGVCFRIEVRCIKPFTPGAQCVNDWNGPVAVGGYDPDNAWEPVTPNHNWFRSLLGEFDLKNYESEAYNAQLLVRGIRPDSYAMELSVYKEPYDRDCANQQFGTAMESLYASKTFILNVV